MAAKARGAMRQLVRRKARKAKVAELKGAAPVYHKPGPPLPPPQTKLLPSGQKEIKTGKIQDNVLPTDSRRVGKAPGITGIVVF